MNQRNEINVKEILEHFYQICILVFEIKFFIQNKNKTSLTKVNGTISISFKRT